MILGEPQLCGQLLQRAAPALAFLILMNISLTRRDPEEMLLRATAQWGGRDDLWVFGYASLIARPEFDATEHRVAHVHGWHRALRMRSRINRGTPEQPGLVFALLPGGSCHGVAYRVPRLTRERMRNARCQPCTCPTRCSVASNSGRAINDA